MPHDQEYLREFVVECREGLDRIDNVLVALEVNPGDKKGLDTVFRALHTIKGNAGFLDFAKLGAIAHAGESLLSQLCGGKLKFNAEIADVLLRTMDAIRGTVAEIEANGTEGVSDFDALKQELAKWTASASDETSNAGSQPVPAPTPTAPPAPANGPRPSQSDLPYTERTILSDPELPLPAPTATFTKPPPQVVSPVQKADVGKSPEPPAVAASNTESEDSWSTSTIGTKTTEPELSTFIRVQIDHLDDLMNLVGELVLARNRIVQIVSSRQDDELTEPIQRLHRLTAALQDGVMRTRMQPVRNAWRKYPRIVRDIAKQCGKLCEVELQGGDTELDKSMLEAIAEPLVHLVRNAIDHGIEKPYIRKIKGKPETGRLLVRAFQESGQVHIEVSDDGAGLDMERIRKKVVDAGMLTPEKAMLASETDLRNSVFLPGFSTADQVTNLSGRGVGMDVVKTCVEQIGGTIELQTRKDVGTTIRLTVPLTLAIVPAIMVSCGRQRFAIPQINVVEMLRLRGDDKRQACEQFHDTPVLRLRGELLPMADLCIKLGVRSQCDVTLREALDILVLKTGTRRFALLVDEIGDPQEIVVKPLGELLARQTEYSGAALMGDGTIALILDVLGIARSSGLLTDEQTMLSDSVTIHDEVPRLDEQVLVCQVDGERQIALPLADVVCLEQVPSTTIEHSLTGDVMQYRGDILPLYQLSRKPLSFPGELSAGLMSVVIYRAAKHQLGLLVDRIIDVAPRPVDLRPAELAREIDSRCRVIATAVVLGRVTDFLQVS
ncbi:MAG: CheA signal transduction histidine kinase [Planctomycetaceae bacterium]|nr:CheA signal transduction histidine kinase [Planctomycetaceae bacterium]